MKYYAVKDLKVFQNFLDDIRWDVTPKIFMQPRFAKTEEGKDIECNIDGYMLYIEMVADRPTVVIMKNLPAMSQTVGYLKGVPEDLLNEALTCCAEGECQAGMYPLSKNLEVWLKKELGVS